MRCFHYLTLDVFTDRRFGGNQLAVFPSAFGLTDTEMQRISAELNYSETTFVFPPDDPANTAKVRIFNRTAEMPFAGHPNVGTGFVLGTTSHPDADKFAFEEPAGLVEVRLDRGVNSEVVGAEIDAPMPLALLGELPLDDIAAALSLEAHSIEFMTHSAVRASVGVEFLFVELKAGSLSAAMPNLAAFRVAASHDPKLANRLSIFAYERAGDDVRARMFSPITGTWEDAATGSASATLAALLLMHRTSEASLNVVIHQGEFINRPSTLFARAWRADGEIRAAVRGLCVTIFRGTLELD